MPKATKKSIGDEKKKETVSIPLMNVQGEKEKECVLPKDIFDVEVSEELITQAIRIHLTNLRQGTVRTKTRGDVRGGGRKPWRQKGTGRARQGSIRSPLWVGGGVAHGPKPKNYQLHLSPVMRRKALYSALTLKRKEKEMIAVEGLTTIQPKAKKMREILMKLQLQNKKILLVLPGKEEKVALAARNFPTVSMVPFTDLSTYAVVNSDIVLFMRESIEGIEKKWLTHKN
ncbi:MAG TPA: 50S ribosomal protein L4 [Patescibacteria group bacterium]|nr:50S ribosomal protein L4 [Patescibacteria group bacterium]